jgi:AraC-like DNA-binding protein
MHRESRIICYPPAMGNVSYSSYPLEKEMLLVRAVSGGQVEQAMEILNEVFEMALHQPNIVLQECLRVDLVATCLRIFAFADKIVPRESWEGHGAARRLMRITKLTGLFDEIRVVLTRVCGVIAEQKEQSKETQSDRIREMVEAEWMNASLSVASIAEKLNLHPSYVSRMFKEEQGMGFLEYINRFRVEQASRLLAMSDLSVSEIASRCGYTSDASFIGIFRQYRGITPGKYREEVKNG